MKFLPLGFILLFTLLITETLLFPYKVWLKSSYESELHQVATNLNSFILNELSEPIYISIGISSYIQSHKGDVNNDVLSGWLESLFNYTSHTRNIGVAPDNVLQFIFPLEGNEEAIGINYQDIPDQWPAIEQFMVTGKSQFLGPITLLQGGKAFAYRHPTFVDGHYWGLVSTIIEASSVLSSIKREAELYDVSIRIRNSEGVTFYSNEKKTADTARYRVSQDVPLPNTFWQLDAATSGSPVTLYSARVALAGFLLFILTSSYWLYINVKSRKSEKRRAQQMKSQFLASVSHELKTPLTVLQGSLSLLGQPDLSTEKRTILVNAANEHQQRLNRLILDILDYNLAINQQLPIQIQAVELISLLQNIAEEYESKCKQLRMHFSTKLPEDESYKLRTDSKRLEQVLRHLLDNATKFCNANDSIELSLMIDEKVAISITDTGPGIPEQFISTDSEHFSQHDGSDTRQQGGTGLGLALCKEIIALLDGQLHIDSDSSNGTRVTISWPNKEWPSKKL